MTEKRLWFPPREPEVAIVNLLVDEWNYTGDGRFETQWLHTGWYDDENPNPQISVTPGGENPVGERGWSGIDPSGAGPQSTVHGTVNVDVWVPNDEHPYNVTGVNPKKLVSDLRRECERIVSEHHHGTTYDGKPEFQFLGTDGYIPAPTQEDGPVEHHHNLPVFYTFHKHWKQVAGEGGP